MKRFKFRLEKLLDVKKAKERAIQNELALEIGKQNILIDKQNAHRDNLAQLKKTNHEQMRQNKISFSNLMIYHTYEQNAVSIIRGLQDQVNQMQPKIHEIRTRLDLAVKERKSIEKLKERKFDEWKYQVMKNEEHENDEINMKIFEANRRVASEAIYDSVDQKM